MKTKLIILLTLGISICNGQSIENRFAEIRKKVKMINSGNNLKKDSIEIIGESTEGGHMLYYKDSSGHLRKLVAYFYGENSKQIEEFYISANKLFFGLIQQYDYNRPISWTAKVATENGDNEVFDYSKSVISENTYYFDKNELLIRWIDKNKKIIQDNQNLEKTGVEVIKEFKDLIKRIK
jgi:hypothetical protein